MPEQPDSVATYALSLGFTIARRTVLVEGLTDEKLFRLAARLQLEATGHQLLGSDLSIVAAGFGNRGGTWGVMRELLSLRALARTCLLPNGRPRYRFVGLFDNDRAGRQAIKTIRDLDTSVLEFKDVFRLWPVMPLSTNLDPKSMQSIFERENAPFRGMDWELEDLLPNDFFKAFASEYAGGTVRESCTNGKTHRELSLDGKARLHRFANQHAVRTDVIAVIEVLKALRCYLGLQYCFSEENTI